MNNSSKIGTFKTFSISAVAKGYMIGTQEDSDYKNKTAASIQS